MSYRASNLSTADRRLVLRFGCVLMLPLVVVTIVASVRVEVELKTLIRDRQLRELMDAAGVKNWQPLADIHLVEALLGLLLALTVVIGGLFFLLAPTRRERSAKDMVLLVLLLLAAAGIAICNTVAVFGSESLAQSSVFVPPRFSVPPNAEALLDSLLCSASCHVRANASVASSCDATPTPVALDYAARLNISEWCGLERRQQQNNTTSATNSSELSPFTHLVSDALQCTPMSDWRVALGILVLVTAGLWATLLIVGCTGLISEILQRGNPLAADSEVKKSPGANLVEPHAISGSV